MLLPTCQWYFPCRCGKRGIQIMQIFLCQMNGKASGIIFHMGYIGSYGNFLFEVRLEKCFQFVKRNLPVVKVGVVGSGND